MYADDYFDVFYKNLQDELETKPPSYFSASDLKISYAPIERGAPYRAYGNAVGVIFTKPHQGTPLEHELTILERASKGSKDELEKLQGLIDEYKRIEEELVSKVEVPSALLITHLTLLNSVAGVLEGIEGMKVITSDPVQSAAKMQRYPESVEGLATSLKSIAEFMRQQNIRFTQNETGYIFSSI